MPFFMWLTHRVGKVRHKIAKQTQESLADMSALTEETVSVSGILLTKTFGRQEAAVGRFREANARLAALHPADRRASFALSLPARPLDRRSLLKTPADIW